MEHIPSALLRFSAFVVLGAVLVVAQGCTSHSTRPQIVAHRGASFIAPENTVAAYELAWKMNADAAETDIYLTKDNRAIALHDEDFKRTAGVEKTPEQMTLAEIKKLEVGKWKAPKYEGEPVPTLDEIIATVPPGKQLFVEMKTTAVAPAMAAAIEKSGKKDQMVIIAFEMEALVAAEALMPEVPKLWLIWAPKDEETGEHIPIDPAKLLVAKKAGIDGLDVYWKGVTPELIAASKREGMPLHVWTMNEPADVKRLAEMGITGVTTDKPDVMLALFDPASRMRN